MDVALVQTLLQGDADRTGVQREIATAQQMGITGVPCFIFDGRYAVMGAQPVETLAGVIADVTKKKEESVSSS
jgi:predicted DsbA family dithiol-disulfide isomerase